jgi:glycosyltransferase involved in cell wall biosynthesis
MKTSEENKPLVSIIVRTKDRPKLLIRALNTIFSQTYRPIEVIIVNDGGCELSEETLRKALGDVTLKYIHLNENTGRSHAGNVGIENAHGEYVGLLDDDDEFYPEHLSILTSLLIKSDYKVAYTDSLIVHKEYDSLTGEYREIKQELVYSRDFDYNILIFENYIPFMCLLFDRKALENLGGLDTAFEVYEDYDLLIRLGEKYPFHHIKQTTAHYNIWDSSSQIAQRDDNYNIQKKSYLRLFSKHIDKFTPERIFQYRINKYHEIISRDNRIAGLDSELKGKNIHIGNLDTHIRNLDTLIKEKEKHLNGMRDVIKAKDQYIAGIISQIEQKDEEIAKINKGLHERKAALETIYGSKGWKALVQMYKIRDKILPPETFRKRFAKGLAGSFFSLFKGITGGGTSSENGRFLYHLETDLSKPFVVGEGNALYLHGWCYHTTKKIKTLYIIVDDTQHNVVNLNIYRDDVYKEHSRETDPGRHSLTSGFWVMLPFKRIDYHHQATLSLRAELKGGEICSSSPVIIELEPEIEKPEDLSKEPVMSSSEPVIAICMTTYNPSINHFTKQVTSIIRQNYSNWICIINDDCSKPEIYEKLKTIVASDRRFVIHRNESNLGFYYNFEKCLLYVPDKASFIALSDQDDYWYKDKLAALHEVFDESTMLAYSDMNIVDEDGETIHTTYWTTRENNFTELDLLLIANTITGAASMFRRELLKFLLPFPERTGDAYHDNFIACSALSLGKIRYVNRQLYDYYQHPGNVVGHFTPDNNSSENKQNFFNILKAGRPGVFMNNCKEYFINYQRVYFDHYITRVLFAHVLNLRFKDMRTDKKKIINRFLSLERSMYGMIYQVLKDRVLHKNRVTIGVDSLILRSAFANKLVNVYYNLYRIFSNR